MAEAVGILAGELRAVRSHELAADEGRQRRAQLDLGRGERLHRAAMECPAFDRAALEHLALGRMELVEAGSEQCLDRRRHAHVPIGRVTDEADHLLDEERVPFGCVEDPAAQLVTDVGFVEQALDELFGLARAERLQQHGRGVQLAATPVRPAVEQLGPGHAEQQDRRAAAQVGDVVDEVEERPPRPSGCRRAPRRAALARLPLRAADGSPRRSPRPRSGRRPRRAPRGALASPTGRGRAPRAAGRLSCPRSCLTISTTGQ